ncbi:DivIVA domain-containing protein [Micrococcales bacterium 31B]|nr:DivIVA domain-containing protein [Micrococcales bacterium 31B]
MALTPNDLLEKRFTPTKFKEGYDQDEVDDYLDNVILPELTKLIDENAELKNQVAALEAQLEAGGDAPAAATAVTEAAAPAETASTSVAAAAPVAASAAASAPGGPIDANNMLVLAQRVHDEHVANGQATADRLVNEAELKARQIVGEAEEKSRLTLENLERERTGLERKIDQMRSFERDYRARLKGYLEQQLQELEANGPGSGKLQPAV